MKVIFLDIDGVLNSYTYYEASGVEDSMDSVCPIDQATVLRLKKIVDATDAALVLTSSWRGGWEKNPEACGIEGKLINTELKKADLAIFDRTGFCETQGSGARAVEIKHWLKHSKEVIDGFVIIDDADYEWEQYGLYKRWVQTDFLENGLEEKHIAPCIELLNQSSFRLQIRNQWKKLAKYFPGHK